LQFILDHFGELAALGAALLWALSTCLFRRFGSGVPAARLNLFKGVVAIVALFVTLLITQPPLPIRASDWLLLALSGIVGLAIGDTAFFVALPRLGAQATSAIQCLAPPLTALLAFVTLGEEMSPFELLGLAVTLAAVAGVIRFGTRGRGALPDLGPRAVTTGVICAIVAAVAQAIGVVLARDAFAEVDVVAGTVLRFVPSVIVLLAVRVLWKRGAAVTAPLPLGSSRSLGLLAAAFAGTYLGVLCFSAGTKYTKAGIVTSISHTYPVWIIPLAALILGERSSWPSVLFTVLAVTGVGLMFL
jgi:drug/metabolite transporter (DMT)-like permease